MAKSRPSDARFNELSQDIDVAKFRESVKADFADFPDPRRGGQILYPAWYLLLVILCGYLSGANTIEELADVARLRGAWMAELTGLELDAPSYNTLWWFLVRTDPSAFKQLISRWLKGLPSDLKDQLLVIDGKRLRGISNSEHIVHVVELFAAESQLTLAQERVPDKAQEIAALPALLDAVNVKGAVVSMDALYAHVSDVQEVLYRGADYIVGIKGNQANLEAEIVNFFEQAQEVSIEEASLTTHTTEGKGHGRVEKRQIIVTNELEWLPQQKAWGLQSLIKVISERCVDGVVERAIRYYGSSRKANALQFSKWIRAHWSIENNLHYIVDVVFGEDASLADSGYAAENIALIKRLSMNVVRAVDPQRGMAATRRCAAFAPRYLRGVLSSLFC